MLVKHGYDAFQIPDLEPCLRTAGIRTVVVTGVVTNLCVFGTVTSAFERGYYAVVPEECTAGTDPPAVAHALQSVREFYGEVVPLDQVLRIWSAGASG